MVSRFYRYLSLLLVMVIVTSWFVLPESLQPFVPSGVEEAQAQAAVLDPTVDGVGGSTSNTIDAATLAKGVVDNTCSKKYDPTKDGSKLFDPSIRLATKLPGYQHICYFFDGDTLVHQFRYQLPGANSIVYHQRYVKDPLPVFGGCRVRSTACSTDPGQFNFFSYMEPVDQKQDVEVSLNATGVGEVTEFGGGASTTEKVTETRKSSTPVQLYRFEPALKNAAGAADPNFNAYLITYNKQYIYGFYEEQNLSRLNPSATKATRDQDRAKTFSNSDDSLDLHLIKPKPANSYLSGNQSRPQYQYVAAVNGLYGYKPTYCIGANVCKILPDTATIQQKFELTKTNIIGVFGQVTNKVTNSLSGTATTSTPREITTDVTGVTGTGYSGGVGSGGNLAQTTTDTFNHIDGEVDLTDDPAASDKKSPETSPILTISNVHTGLPGNVIFKLKYALRVSTTASGKQNNYFVFELDKRTNEATQNALTNRGLDPSLYYAVIDLTGNLGFVVENTSLNGGVLSSGGQGKDNINSYTAIGDFGGNLGSYSTSKNILNLPLSVNLEQYKNILTKRVYNEPNIPKVANADCQGSPALAYPDLNTRYDDPANVGLFPYGIPVGDYRKCIHIAETNETNPGWLAKWGIADVKLDTSSDACDQSTQGMSDMGKVIGKSLCWMLSILVGLGTNFAGFAIDFMLSTIDLQ